MPDIAVHHALGSYTVRIEGGILLALPALFEALWGERPLVMVTDDTVGKLYDEWTGATTAARQLGARSSDAGIRLRPALRLTFPAGEASKTRETWQRLSDQMLEKKVPRDAALVAIGGGVVGDVAGFVAATYLRGIPYAQVPTTLLAMLDASVGGKVGVDTPHGKNLVGAFHPPAIVAADPLTLLGLPERAYRAGFAEAIKHGLIADQEYFAWIEANVQPLLARDAGALTELIRRSVQIKAEVVSADERESGRRAILNAGHSIAHGLEMESGFALPHGEAVALGLIAEAQVAERLGLAGEGLAQRVARLTAAFGLPRRLPKGVKLNAVLDAMEMDKKNREGALRLALPSALGRMHEKAGQWTTPVERGVLEQVLATLS